MKKPHIDLQTLSSTSARELLEKYLYGSGDVAGSLGVTIANTRYRNNLIGANGNAITLQ